MKKIASFLSLLAIFNLLALAAVIIYLSSTNRLDGAKAHAIADLLRHQGEPPALREKLADILDPKPAATAPATQSAATQSSDGDIPLAASAQDRLDFARQAMEQERLRLETQAQDLQHRQELLEREQAAFAQKVDALEKDKKDFDARVAAASTKTKDDNFQKSLALYDQMKPDQIKEIFVGMQPDVVADFLLAMDPSRAGKIIGEFQTDQEQKYIASVLELIRTRGTDSASASATPAKPSGS
ncbi:MAG TPA: hypothetical protein VHQ47_02525 [Phycisphaerae bacterium]|jgi:flagellar motility protein MotE (MotC chaperone)|nr:hypothetical protein [Phycisphaerae bacterium]